MPPSGGTSWGWSMVAADLLSKLSQKLAGLERVLYGRLPHKFQHVLDVAAEALDAERKRIKDKARSREAMEFLPAALEVLETPPSPVGRGLAWALMALFTIGVIWSAIGEIDIVAVAQGKIIPSSYTQVLQPLEAGVVRAIHVRDGDHVTKDQVLIELDPTQTGADRDNLSGQLAAARAEAARYVAEVAPNPMAAFTLPADVPDAVYSQNRRLLVQEVETQRARLAGLDSEIAKAAADLATGRSTVDKLGKTVPLLRERVEAKGILASQGYSPRLDQLELQQQLVEQEQELIASRHRVDQSAAALESARQARAQADADYRRNAMTQGQEADKKVASLTQDLAKAEQRQGQQKLTAPISGTVQELAVHTEGGVVQQAQKILSIVPDNSGLEIEAKVLNRDVGFVVEGQEAEIKLDAYQYTKYGTIPGTVTWVSRDAVQDEKLGLLYPARVSLAKTQIDVGPRSVNLGPGLSAEVEIKTEKRRIIEYLISSLQQYRHESMRER